MQRSSLLFIALALLIGRVSAQDELEKRATWSIPPTAEVKARLDNYLAKKTLDDAAKLKIDAIWPDEAQPLDGGELLDRLTASLAVVEPKAAEIVAACRQNSIELAAKKFDGLADESLPALVRDHLRLL